MKHQTIALGGLILLLLVVIWIGAAVWWIQPFHGRTVDFVPRTLEPDHGYVGSAACKSCHPDEHASWHASYHRSMTQLPTPQTVVAPFDDTLFRFGWPYHFQRRGDEFWVDMVDPDWEYALGGRYEFFAGDPPRVRKKIALVTGSHNKQTYWVASSQRESLLRVPWSYRIDDQRWIPLEADYLSPPDAGASGGIWDDTCIQCHAVAGQPRQHESGFDPHVAELGIACEACHGPGADHIQFREEAGADAGRGSESRGLDPIVNPRDQSALASSQICGQCHVTSVIKDYPEFLQNGFGFRPGQDLSDTMHVLRYVENPQEEWLRAVVRQDPHLLENRFWKDGTIRVTGREFNGLVESPCHQRGELSCLSCHSLHGYMDADDQLGQDMHGNQACLQCHPAKAADITAHTHHLPDSSGSLCYNCHMPHTTYGLFKGVRAHKIDSPSAVRSLQTGRPSACNLCHLDKTLAWSGEKLHDWYGQPRGEFPHQHAQTAASLVWLLSGDAAQRVILAWHFGWQPARQASGEGWLPPFLAVTLDDPYSAVRHVAGRSLTKLPGFTDFEYDFLAPQEARNESVQRALQRWKNDAGRKQHVGSILLQGNGEFTPEFERLRQQRDDRPVDIAE